jgi:hypothetical protein
MYLLRSEPFCCFMFERQQRDIVRNVSPEVAGAAHGAAHAAHQPTLDEVPR